jgi:general stress protein YciG
LLDNHSKKGGLAPHYRRGLQAADLVTRLRVSKSGADARAQNEEGLVSAGRKGGQATKANHDIEYYKTIGEQGGNTTKQRYGIEFYKRVGEKGGLIIKEKYGPQYYSRIGKH